MNLTELLKEKLLDLPKGFNSNLFNKNLEDLFTEYIIILKKNRFLLKDFASEVIDKAEYLSLKIIECLNDYKNGKEGIAFNNFSEALNQIKEDLLYAKGDSIYLANGIDHGFYRIRLSNEIKKEQRDFFHNPFENKNALKDYRYSIPNIPNLYLGKSIWTCWEELRKPSLDEINVARFDIDYNKLKLFYLSQTPKELFFLYKNSNHELVEQTKFTSIISLLIRWPLMASCSIKVYDESLKNKPEYIIPHLLLKYIQQSHNLDGILYFSTRLESHSDDFPEYGTNLVLPAKNIEQSGFCKILTKKLRLTNGISFKENRHLPKKLISDYNEAEIDNWLKKSIEGFLKDDTYRRRNKLHWFTIFSKLEIELCKMETDYLNF